MRFSARTGEPYAVARREVMREHQAAGERPGSDKEWFAISYSNAATSRLAAWLGTLFGGGPGKAGVEVDPDQIRVRRCRTLRTGSCPAYELRAAVRVGPMIGRGLKTG